ncbi:hypothetical protein, partial [Mycolicibacterium hodleri]|uniref:hypothetical protein n=1 Tax=Mycolicibacterium hodleri TaxID=49897 RepID=UPI001C8E4741
TSQNWQIKQNHLMQQEDGKSPTKMAKNNKQKPPNTLLSSQTTDQILAKFPVSGQPCQLKLSEPESQTSLSPVLGQLD